MPQPRPKRMPSPTSRRTIRRLLPGPGSERSAVGRWGAEAGAGALLWGCVAVAMAMWIVRESGTGRLPRWWSVERGDDAFRAGERHAGGLIGRERVHELGA